MKFYATGFESKMKIPNSEIIETWRRKGRNKKNEGFRVKMDFFCFVSENENQIDFFSYFIKETAKKLKKTINFNHKIVWNSMLQGLNHQRFGFWLSEYFYSNVFRSSTVLSCSLAPSMSPVNFWQNFFEKIVKWWKVFRI